MFEKVLKMKLKEHFFSASLYSETCDNSRTDARMDTHRKFVSVVKIFVFPKLRTVSIFGFLDSQFKMKNSEYF